VIALVDALTAGTTRQSVRRAVSAPAALVAPIDDLSAKLGYGPTLRQLLAHFAVLRRSPTAVDRAWAKLQPGEPSSEVAPRGYARQLATVGRTRIGFYLDGVRTRPGGPLVAYQLVVADWTPVGGSSAPYTFAAGQYDIVPPTGDLAPWSATIVPDGVSRVRWTFTCRRTPACLPSGRGVIVGRVHDNVAIMWSAPSSSDRYHVPSGYDLPVPEVTWFRDGDAKPMAMAPSSVPWPGAPQ
jgi:hypothetical protein